MRREILMVAGQRQQCQTCTDTGGEDSHRCEWIFLYLFLVFHIYVFFHSGHLVLGEVGVQEVINDGTGQKKTIKYRCLY